MCFAAARPAMCERELLDRLRWFEHVRSEFVSVLASDHVFFRDEPGKKYAPQPHRPLTSTWLRGDWSSLCCPHLGACIV